MAINLTQTINISINFPPQVEMFACARKMDGSRVIVAYSLDVWGRFYGGTMVTARDVFGEEETKSVPFSTLEPIRACHFKNLEKLELFKMLYPNEKIIE